VAPNGLAATVAHLSRVPQPPPGWENDDRYHVWREPDGFSDRALYVIDPHGRIAYRHVSPYLHHIPDLDELLAAVDEARSTTDYPAAAQTTKGEQLR
jgi:alkyl hydroperoxide reductase subunit AhpC